MVNQPITLQKGNKVKIIKTTNNQCYNKPGDVIDKEAIIVGFDKDKIYVNIIEFECLLWFIEKDIILI